ncbi:SDR family NAD(P)-dependent oxidoreductase [Nocardia sp. NPDC127526]|uniref:SDR family NAD(P)-dependent oxidoreductase n=1 Tax=Nocardia sp. NPDC127526 TaxID=3345393 RepID=UPI00362E2736
MTGFDNEVVVVTGAGGGIGRATARRFAREGAVVVAADPDKDRAIETVEAITAFGGAATPWAVDVADRAAMADFAEDVHAEFGPPRVLVNTAGYATDGPFLDHTREDWERLMGVNVWGLVHGSTFFGRQMVASGRGGRIINVTSVAAFAPAAMSTPYRTTEAAARMLTEGLRLEFAGTGVGVTALCPAPVDTGSDDEGELDRVAHTIVRVAARHPTVAPTSLRARALYLLSRIDGLVEKRLERRHIADR